MKCKRTSTVLASGATQRFTSQNSCSTQRSHSPCAQEGAALCLARALFHKPSFTEDEVSVVYVRIGHFLKTVHLSARHTLIEALNNLVKRSRKAYEKFVASSVHLMLRELENSSKFEL